MNDNSLFIVEFSLYYLLSPHSMCYLFIFDLNTVNLSSQALYTWWLMKYSYMYVSYLNFLQLDKPLSVILFIKYPPDVFYILIDN